MASSYWIKLYYEVIDDPKMGRLCDRLWRRFFELCMLAAEEQDEGYLPPVADIAWRLRLTEEELIADLRALEAVKREDSEHGLVTACSPGWKVTNLTKRQRAVPPDERKRKQRERDKKAEYYCHETVTTRDTDIEEEREEEGDTEEEATHTTPAPTTKPITPAMRHYESLYGVFDSRPDLEALLATEELVGSDKVNAAVSWAHNKAPPIKNMASICTAARNWTQSTGPPGNNGQSSADITLDVIRKLEEEERANNTSATQ